MAPVGAVVVAVVVAVGAAGLALFSSRSIVSSLAGAARAADDFKGVTVNVMTFAGPQIAEPLQRRAPEFEKLTGAKVNILTVPFSDLYQKLLTDWASGTNSVDAAVFAPQWMVDYTKGGFLEDLSARVAKDAALKEKGVNAQIQARQLYHDREEVTVHVRRIWAAVGGRRDER